MRESDSPKLRAAVIETLENRCLMSLSMMPSSGVDQSIAAMLSFSSSSSSSSSRAAAQKVGGGATLLAVQPMVTGSNPANGAVDVPRYSPLTMTVQLADTGAGIDPATLNL